MNFAINRCRIKIMGQNNEKFDFEEALKEINQIADDFERKDIALEEGLKKFERGLMLAEKCKSRLKEVENKIEEIKVKFKDAIKEEEE